MKIPLTFILCAAAGLAVFGAAEKIEMKKVAACYLTNGKSSPLLTADGLLSLKGSGSEKTGYQYLVARVDAKPFVLTGKSLVMEVKAADFRPNDSFYIKGVDAQGKRVFSFRVVSDLSGGWNKLILTPGSTNGGVIHSAGDIQAPETNGVTALQFFCGRMGPVGEMNMEIRNLRLEDRQAKSDVEQEPQKAPGKLTVLTVSSIYVPKAKAAFTLTKDGKVTLKGEVNYEKYNYLVARIQVRPFVLDGHALTVKLKGANFVKNDSFYVKCLNKDGKIVASFVTRKNLTGGFTMNCIPGRNTAGVLFNAGETKAPADSPVVTLQIFCGRPGPAVPIEIEIESLELNKTAAVNTAAVFFDHGIGIQSAEVRNFIACHGKDGRRLIVCGPSDIGPDYLLFTDLKTGVTTQHYSGCTGGTYGGILTDDGKYIYGVGGTVCIFDINTRKMIRGGKCVTANLCATLGPDGTVYFGGASQSRVTKIDPATGKTEDLGRFDDREDYVSTLAVDKAGFVYAGIGTARANITAMDPRTGKRVQLLPEEFRKLGSGTVIAGEDGFVYVEFGGFSAKCLEGKIVERGVRCPQRKKILNVKYQSRLKYFDDGAEIVRYDTDRREIVVREKNGTEKQYKFDYVSAGLHLTSLTAGPDGNIYFNSAHPHHLGKLDTATGKITDLGFNPRVGGGNFCNMTAFGGKVYGCEYGGGRLWEYDPARPPAYESSLITNFGVPFPELLHFSSAKEGRWRDLGNPAVLLAVAGGENNEFTLDLRVPSPGKRFLNLQFLMAGSYGTVTIRAGGREWTVDTFASDQDPGRMLNLGPFEIKAEKFPVTFHVKKSPNPASRLLFSLTGIELAEKPRPPFVRASGPRNPKVLGRWHDLVHRPRAIAIDPATREAVIAGYANYGMTGGGFGICGLSTGKTREIASWLPGESCYDMEFQPDGNLLGATSIEAPGGGHVSAKAASVFLMDWKTGKVIRRAAFEDERTFCGVRGFAGSIYAVSQGGTLYRIDPATFRVIKQFDTPGSPLIRNPLIKTPDGKRLFVLTGRWILEIDPRSGEMVEVDYTPIHLSAGAGIVRGKLYAAAGPRIVSWQIPPPLKR